MKNRIMVDNKKSNGTGVVYNLVIVEEYGIKPESFIRLTPGFNKINEGSIE